MYISMNTSGIALEKALLARHVAPLPMPSSRRRGRGSVKPTGCRLARPRMKSATSWLRDLGQSTEPL